MISPVTHFYLLFPHELCTMYTKIAGQISSKGAMSKWNLRTKYDTVCLPCKSLFTSFEYIQIRSAIRLKTTKYYILWTLIKQCHHQNYFLIWCIDSQFNLFIYRWREWELCESLPLLWCADAVIRKLFHCHPVNTLWMSYPMIHL